MDAEPRACPECARALSPADTVVAANGRLTHLDCKRPKALRPEERALLFRHCSGHPVAQCGPCARGYLMSELASDLFTGRDQLCPGCHADLSDSVRSHLESCSVLPEMIRQRARAVRETTHLLMKRTHELTATVDVQLRELEAKLQALRETIR